MSKKSILGQVYAYLVLFGCVITFIVSLGISSYKFIQYNYPDVTMNSYNYQIYIDYEHYKEQETNRIKNDNRFDNAGKQRNDEELSSLLPTEKEFKEKWEKKKKVLALTEAKDGLKDFIQSFIYVVIAILVFIPHMFLIRIINRRQNAIAND